METHVSEIAKLNDEYRRKILGCTLTRGIAELVPIIGDILERVRKFDDFNEENDPHNEHDFGSFEILGVEVFWKIDYYNQDLKGWCDPLDPKCRRELTVMRAEEY
jgi:uncharacterized protein DUF3768